MEDIIVRIKGSDLVGSVVETSDDGIYVETFELGIIICQPRDLIVISVPEPANV